VRRCGPAHDPSLGRFSQCISSEAPETVGLAKVLPLCDTFEVTSPASVLNREVYSEPEAARLLGLAPSTLRYWLNGGERRGRVYPPVIRREAVDRRWVTWAEFIEAGWLSEYRRSKGIPMLELRDFIGQLRDEMGVPYPLAHHRPFTSGKKLILRAQDAAHLDPGDYLVAAVGEQRLLLTHWSAKFVDRVEWKGDIAGAWKPDANPRSTVRASPEVRFGKPAVSGVSTLSIFEQSEAGASLDEIATDFDLSKRDVRWAISYEIGRRAA